MIQTRLTRKFGLEHPVIQAPMAFAAAGRLASAASKAGGLGLIGGAYGDEEWIKDQFDAAGNQQVGCGFITCSLKEKPELLDHVLERNPSAVFLSFGDPARFVEQIKAANVPLICQIQTLRDAMQAIDVGADLIVVQGAEAGGHGEKRATFTLVLEVADYISAHAPETLLCAAGGVGDGRGLAAALMLGFATSPLRPFYFGNVECAGTCSRSEAHEGCSEANILTRSTTLGGALRDPAGTIIFVPSPFIHGTPDPQTRQNDFEISRSGT